MGSITKLSKDDVLERLPRRGSAQVARVESSGRKAWKRAETKGRTAIKRAERRRPRARRSGISAISSAAKDLSRSVAEPIRRRERARRWRKRARIATAAGAATGAGAYVLGDDARRAALKERVMSLFGHDQGSRVATTPVEGVSDNPVNGNQSESRISAAS